MNVNQQQDLLPGLSEEWDLIEALMGGTRTMREAGRLYLPQRPMEEDEDYAARLRSATLFPAFTETLGVMAGRVFAQPMMRSDVPEWMETEVLDDVDRTGRNLHVFAADWWTQALAYGLSHVLVDAPPASGALTREDARRAGLRPYLVHISPRQVLGWREQGGIVTQLRIRTSRVEDDGEFGQREVQQVRVFDLAGSQVRVRLFEKSAGEFAQVGESALSVPRIPLVTFYTGRVAFMQARPPLRELAYLNAKHWRMQSGHDTLIDTATVPILFGRGFEGREVVIGGKHMVTVDSPTAELRYVEHTGAAIESGGKALEGLKDEMRQAGAKLLIPQGANKTAAQATEEANRENSALGRMVQDFEDAVDDLLDTIAMWRGEQDGGSAKVRANLDPDFAPAESMRILQEMRRDGDLSAQTLFAEAQRRGMIAPEVAWEDEQERTSNQPPAL